MNEKDKEFIDNVRKKIIYTEHVRMKEEKFKKNIKISLVFSTILCVILIPAFITKNFDTIYVIALGIYILSFGCYYENYLKETSK